MDPALAKESILQYDSEFCRSRKLPDQRKRHGIRRTQRPALERGLKSGSADIQEVIMWLNESEQELRRDLQGLASDLRWSAVELLRVAEQLRQSGNEVDAQAVQRLCDLFQGDEQRLIDYAEEVKAKTISRNKAG
jgi:hypothetical protein